MSPEKVNYSFELKIISLALTYALLMCTVGCSKNYSFPKAVYDGIQTHDQLQSTPAERAGKPEPLNYQQYDAERKRP
jgi:hypothetical protein